MHNFAVSLDGVTHTGRLWLNEWITESCERRSKLQVVADDVAFLDPPKVEAGAA